MMVQVFRSPEKAGFFDMAGFDIGRTPDMYVAAAVREIVIASSHLG